MTKDGLTYISQYLRFINDDEQIIRIIKLNYNVWISKEDFKGISLPEPYDRYFCSLTGTAMVNAYEPFGEVLRDMVGKYYPDPSLLLENASVYQLHRDIFLSYFSTGNAKREESLLLNELTYEKDKMITGIVNLLLLIAKDHPLFIMINNAGQLCDSTLAVLERLMEEKSQFFKLLLITSETAALKNYIAERYNAFLKLNETTGSIVYHTIDDLIDKEADKAFLFSNTPEELNQIENMLQTLAIEQARYYLALIYQKIEVDKYPCTAAYKRKLLSLYTYTCIYTENYSFALALCDKLSETSTEDPQENLLKEYDCSYYRALAHMYTGNIADSLAVAGACISCAEKTGDEYLIMRAMITRYMAHLAGWKDVWLCQKEIPVSDRLISLCEKYHYYNHLAHMFVYNYHNDTAIYQTPDGLKDRIPYFVRGIELSKQIGNDKLIFEAYRKGVMMASSNGFFATSTYFYKLSIEIVQKTHNRFEEASIYNGLGYDCCSADEFEKAHDYYNKALKLFFKLHSTDYILETLYNMGTNAVLAGDYANAINYLTTVTDSFKLLKKDRLRVCNLSKLLGLIAIAAFKLGNYALAHLYFERAGHSLALGHLLERNTEEYQAYLWGDDIFLYHYMSALIDTEEGRTDEALRCYDMAETYMLARSGSMFCNYVLFALDKAALLRQLSRTEEADSLLLEARSWYAAHGNALRVRMFDACLAGTDPELSVPALTIQNITLQQIRDYMQLESIKQAILQKDKQLEFLGAFQEVIHSEYHSVQEAVDTLLNHFKVNFNLDNVLFISCNKERGTIIFSDLEYSLTEDAIATIVQYFTVNTNGFSLSGFSNNHENYKALHMLFAGSKLSSMVAIPIYNGNRLNSVFFAFCKISDNCNVLLKRDTLGDSDLSVFVIIFRQVLGAIEKYNLNELLQKQAVTDELTGLYNRNGYYMLIEKYLENIRLHVQSNAITLMYIDLDNFKYYNDTFGHHVGDEILKQFAAIFVNACDHHGNAIRFGGDEFMILLDTADPDIIDSIIEHIYLQIRRERGFCELISRLLNERGILIPGKYKATCSIGIESSHNIKTEADYTTLEKHADAALYYGKKHGKGKAIQYRELEILNTAAP